MLEHCRRFPFHGCAYLFSNGGCCAFILLFSWQEEMQEQINVASSCGRAHPLKPPAPLHTGPAPSLTSKDNNKQNPLLARH